jgi:hypothetical protein
VPVNAYAGIFAAARPRRDSTSRRAVAANSMTQRPELKARKLPRTAWTGSPPVRWDGCSSSQSWVQPSSIRSCFSALASPRLGSRLSTNRSYRGRVRDGTSIPTLGEIGPVGRPNRATHKLERILPCGLSMLFALGRGHIIHPLFGRTHPRFGTPWPPSCSAPRSR